MYKNIEKILKEDEEVILSISHKKRVFTKADWALIPVSVLILLPLIIVALLVMYNTALPIAWRISIVPVFLILLYLSIGRYIAKLINKLNTYYFITNKRIIAVRNVFRERVRFAYLSGIKKISKREKRKNTGDIIFHLSSEPIAKIENLGFDFLLPKEGARGMVPMVFFDAEDFESTYKKAYEIRANLDK